MPFRGDERAVTVQIGAVLLFGMLIVSLTLYQATAVPDQNREVEFNHNQFVQEDLLELRNAIIRTGATGYERPVAVTLGRRYPERRLFVNPPPAWGRISTTEEAKFSITNASATNAEAAQYWTGRTRNFSTVGLQYEPSYHEYHTAPTTVFEGSVLYNRFNDANLTVSGQSVIDGRRISFVVLAGNLTSEGVDAITVDPQATSAPSNTITIENETDPITLVVPTKVPASVWEAELLAEELDPSATDPDRYVSSVRQADRPHAIEIVLEPASYDLDLGKVGVGDVVDSEDEAYIVAVEGTDRSVLTGATEQLVVEVRDRFNNPLSGVTVNVSGVPANRIDPHPDATTSEDGVATFTYTAPSVSGSETVTMNISGSPVDYEQTSFDIDVLTAGGGGGGTAGRLYYVGDAQVADGDDSNSVKGGIEFNVTNTYGENVTITDVTVNPADNAIDGLSDEADGEGYNQSELSIEADVQSMTVDVPLQQGSEYVDIPLDGVVVDLDETGNQTLNGNVVLSAGSEARVYLYEFHDQSANPTNVDVGGKSFTISLHYQIGVATKQVQDSFVVRPAVPPTADAGSNFVVDEGSTGTLDGSASTDDGTIDHYEWAITNNPSGASVSVTDADTSTPQATFDASGANVTGNQQVEVTLTVTDDDGLTATDTVVVTVRDTDGTGGGDLVFNGDGQAVDNPQTAGTTTSSLTFSVMNTYGQALNITDVSIAPDNGNIDRLSDGIVGEGKWETELLVETSPHNGLVDVNQGVTLPATLDMDTDGFEQYEAELASGSAATVYLTEFIEETGPWWNPNETPHDMTGETVQITISYQLANGTTASTSFTVTG